MSVMTHDRQRDVASEAVNEAPELAGGSMAQDGVAAEVQDRRHLGGKRGLTGEPNDEYAAVDP
jgi:hypothetical protein